MYFSFIFFDLFSYLFRPNPYKVINIYIVGHIKKCWLNIITTKCVIFAFAIRNLV